MPRSRNIKPGLFKNEILGDADPIYSLLFVGLWTLADKEGRLENRPKKIKAEIFPYRFDLDLSMALAWLMDESFIVEYGIGGKSYFQINNWHKHQSPHHKEVKSEIPSIEQVEKLNENQRLADAQLKHDSSMDHGQLKESASSPLIPDSLNLIPDSLNLIPDSLNLIPSGTTSVDSSPPKKQVKRFVKPTPQELIEHFNSKGSNQDESEKFFNYYESNGWKVGKNPMKNWKAAASNWAKNNYSQPNTGQQINKDDTSWANNMQAPYLPNQPKALGHE